MTAVRRIIGIPLTLLIALVLQVAVVNRAPLPGAAGPDLVLLTVTALGAMLGPMTGLIAGFCGGLALDVAPPAGHLAGEYALVFCLAGYACGRMRDLVDPMEHATVTSVTVMAVGAAGGEALKAALGLMLSDPDVTGPAVKHVLPGAILYDLLLSPFVLWLVALAVARPARPPVPDPHRRVPRTAAQYGAFRLATAGSAPKLRLGGGLMTPARSPIRREPKLRLAGSTSPALSRTGNGASPSSLSLGGRRPVSLNFSGTGGGLLGGGLPGGALGPSLFSGSPLRGASGLSKGWLRAGKPGGGTGPARGIAGRGPGKGWLRAGKPGSGTRPARGITGTGPGKGWLRAGKPGSGTRPARGITGKGPGKGWLWSSSGPGASALRATPDWRRNQPGKRWLRPSKPAKAPHVNSPGKGWLRPPKPAKAVRRHSPGKGWLKAGKPAPAWRPKSPGRGWLNGSGVLGKPMMYQSRSAPLRRRRRLRIGGRR
jgi:rod shape-determining protein MreD